MSRTLAVKALNQYRKRDIIPYLGLRYYLENISACESRWINEISCRLTLDNKSLSYLKVFHLKDFVDEKYIHREIFIPAPNEALSEVALIAEISKYSEFHPKSYVFSYRFSGEKENNGVFSPYFIGFKERHKNIADACRVAENDFVLYTDIKKFYPNIQSKDAISAWIDACKKSKIEKKFQSLGMKILENHKAVCCEHDGGKGLLTGPIFSHVIANLLFDTIDIKMNEITNGRYWRYVDDVVMAGTANEIRLWRNNLSGYLSELGLELHNGDKDFEVECSKWIKSEYDFDNLMGDDWIVLISDIKRFLLSRPEHTENLREAFKANHIRIPVIDYSNLVMQSSYLVKCKDWMRKYKWAKKSVVNINIEYLLRSAKQCENKFLTKINKIIELPYTENIFDQKRLTPKLRYLAGRLLYLLCDDDLEKLSNRLSKFKDLFLISKTMKAVATKNVTEILQMGTNATHITAQLLRSTNSRVTIDIKDFSDDPLMEQSVAILELNGIFHDANKGVIELRRLAVADEIFDLMKSDDGFIKEFSCLHGVLPARHQQMLNSSFDRDEDLALDVLNQIQNSSHC